MGQRRAWGFWSGLGWMAQRIGLWGLWLVALGSAGAQEAVPAWHEEVVSKSAAFAEAFGKADAPAVAAHFAQRGELIDEEGVIYTGREEIAALLQTFFEQFPGAVLQVEIESIREVAPGILIEEGVRTISVDGVTPASARVRYTSVLTREEDRWVHASLRQVADDPLPAPGERLAALDWLIGEWRAEGSESNVEVAVRRSEDGNYLIGEISTLVQGVRVLGTTQRIGWDPSQGRIRSWLFDTDGGFSEGIWTPTELGWMIRTEGVLPDGNTASATVLYELVDRDRFVMRGMHRVIGDRTDADFELTIIRRPPRPE